jgi:hypothetical protein
MAGVCFECGQPASHRHHVVPRSRGGTQTVPLCEPCHGKAHDRVMRTSALTSHALQKKKPRGERTGKIRWGYTLADDGKTLVPNEAEQGISRTIFELRAQGLTVRAIAAELEQRGVVTRNGKPLRFSWIGKILRDRKGLQ